MIGQLSDILDFKNGKKRPPDEGSIPVYGGNGILGYTNDYNYENCIAIGRVGAYCGSVYYEKGPCWISDNAIAALPKEKADIIYAYYLLKSLKLNERRIGTSQPLLTQGILNKISADILPYDQQVKVGKILKRFDNAIQLNDGINANLSLQLQALFMKLFVDEADSSWPIKKLGDYLTLERGLSYKGKYLSDSDGVPMINLGNILPNSVFRPEKLKFYTGEFKPKVVVKPGDVVVANTDLTQAREVLGSAIRIPELGYETIICSHHISIVRNCKLPKNFILGMLNVPAYRERVAGYATGTTVLALPNETILNCEFALPPADLINQFDVTAEKYYAMMEQNRINNTELTEIRNTLLPKLMNGELNVSGVNI